MATPDIRQETRSSKENGLSYQHQTWQDHGTVAWLLLKCAICRVLLLPAWDRWSHYTYDCLGF